MALVHKDRVKETSTTTGTGTYTLLGAVSGFQSFGAIGNGNTCYYTATDGVDWEVGLGTYTSAGTTLARTSVLASSNAGSAVNWGAGTRTIFCDVPASKFRGIGEVVASSDLPAAALSGLVQVNDYTSTQTITIPTGATRARVFLWGGTGGGAGFNTTFLVFGTGGAGAGALTKFLIGLTPGNTLAYTQGAAGSAGASNGDGGAGGNSSLASGTQSITTLTANGGAGGPRSTSGTTSGGASAGGTATNGDRNMKGQNGVRSAADSSGSTIVSGIGGMTGNGWSRGGNPGTSTTGEAGEVGGCTIEWYY